MRGVFRSVVAFCLGTSVLALPAVAASFSVGGGTITTTQADNSVDNTGTGGAFELQANRVSSGDAIAISNVNTTALDVGNLLPSTGSYSVTMHGSTLSSYTFFRSINGGPISFDSTGGAANTLSGSVALNVGVNSGSGGVSVKTGADVISGIGVGPGGIAISAVGPGTVSVDTVGATITSAGLYGIVAQSGGGNVVIGGLNGGMASSITATSGYGIYTSAVGNISVTIASSGSINALNGILMSGIGLSVDNFGTLVATNNAIDANAFGQLNVTLEAGSTTSGRLLGSSNGSGDTFTISGGANIAGATFDGNGGNDTLILTGTGIASLDLSTVSNIQNLQKNQAGTWTMLGPGTITDVTVNAGILNVLGPGTLTNVTVNGGILNVGSTTALARDPSVTVNGGTFDTNNQTITVGPLSGTGGVIALGSGNLTTNSNTNTSLAAIISGSGGLDQEGSGTLTLTGVNTYTGVTTLGSGTLALSGSGSIASSRIVGMDEGTFDISATTNGTTIQALVGSGRSKVILGSKTLTITNNTAIFSHIFGGNISGSGGLTISGGALYFDGMNSYTGPTTIASGATLGMSFFPQSIAASSNVVVNGTFDLNGIGAVIKSLSGSGAVIGGSSLTITNASGTFSGTIGSDVPAALTIAGGTQTLSGANTLSTATINSGATLTISGAGSFAPANNTFIDNGTLDISGATSGISVQFLSGTGAVVLGSNTLTLANPAGTGFTSTFAGVISGTGGITIGGGTGGSGANRILTGNNIYSGTTTIQNGGTLQIGNGGTAGAIVSNVTDSGTLVFNRSDTYSFSGIISGAGAVSKMAAGTLTLSGTNTYTGSTAISAGTLNVTGSIPSSAVTVASGATLNGTGTVGATTIQNGATLAPGNSIGTLTVNGNLSLASGAIYNLELSPTASDRVQVNGTANLNGTVATSLTSGAYSLGQRYTIVTAANGVSGNFASLTGIPVSFKGELSYDANNAYLTLSPNPLAPLLTNATGNQQKLVAAIDAAVAAGNVPPAGFSALYNLSGPALNNALDQISGQAAPNVINAVGQGFGSFMAMTAGGGTGNFAPGNAYGAADAPHRAQLGAGETRVWGAVYGGHIGLSGDSVSGSAGLTSNNVGLIGGVDRRLTDNILAGVTLGLGEQLFHSGNGTGDSHDFMIGAYGRLDAGAAYVTASLGFGWHHIRTQRIVFVSGIDVLQGKQNADDVGGRIETGWRFHLQDGYGLSPYAAFAGSSFSSPAYAETALSGASTFALSYAAQTTGLGRSELGAHLDRRYELEQRVLTADAHIAWAHQLDDLPFTQASFISLPGAAFQTVGVRPGRDSALLGLDLEIQNNSGLFFGLKGESQLGPGTTVIEGLGNFGWRW